MDSGRAASNEEYATDHANRGEAVIIVNDTFQSRTGMEQRKWADFDRSNLENTFTGLGFNVTVWDNLTWKETNERLEEVSKWDHSDNDCFVCVITSHGEWSIIKQRANRDVISDVIYATDDVIPTRNLTSLFTSAKCPTLANKPKLWFIQACRGDTVSEAALVPDPSTGQDEAEMVPTPTTGQDEADLVLTSTTGQGEESEAKLVPTPNTREKSGPKEFEHKPSTLILSDNAKSEDAGSGDFSKPEEGQRGDESEGHMSMMGGGMMRHVQLPFDVPIFQDFLLVCSTQPGNMSFRTPAEGSPFIYHLCKMLQACHKDMDLESILTQVKQEVAYSYTTNMSNHVLSGRKQMPWVASRLTKDVRFHPKK